MKLSARKFEKQWFSQYITSQECFLQNKKRRNLTMKDLQLSLHHVFHNDTYYISNE